MKQPKHKQPFRQRQSIGCLLMLLISPLATTASAETTLPDVHTRTLAASCAACHGAQGNSAGVTPSLANLNADYFVQRMQGFKSGSVAATVMHQHAKGLRDEEITALAHYFAAQSRAPAAALPKQIFQGAQ